MLFCSVHVLKCLAPDPARGAQRCCPYPGWIKWGHFVAGEGKEAGDNRREEKVRKEKNACKVLCRMMEDSAVYRE